YLGVLASGLVFFITGDNYLLGCLLLLIANMSFAAANVFYNAYLVDITTEDNRDRISSYGFAAGYCAGVLVLILNLLLINYAEAIGISTGTAVRISMLTASLWWGIWALVTFLILKERSATKNHDPSVNIIKVGFIEVAKTLKELYGLKQTLLFLAAYLLYNDGIQTVILNSSVFLSQELYVSRGLEVDSGFFVLIFMIAESAALGGALVFERISRYIGPTRTIILSLLSWSCIVIYAYGLLQNKTQAVILASFIGLVLGSAQA